MTVTKTHYIDEETGKEYLRVSTVIDQIYDPIHAHTHWVAEGAADLFQRHLNSEQCETWENVGDDFAPRWVRVPCEAKELLEDTTYLKNVAFRKQKAAADRGTVVDLLFKQVLQGATPDKADLPDMIRDLVFRQQMACEVADVIPYAECLLRWAERRADFVCQGWETDVLVTHSTYDIAGTMDAESRDRKCIVECKTGEGLTWAHIMQCGAYYAMRSKAKECVVIVFRDGNRPALEYLLNRATLRAGWNAWQLLYRHYLASKKTPKPRANAHLKEVKK